jgi:hypothetical protein
MEAIMKFRLISLLLLLAALWLVGIALTAQAQWQLHRLPGGSTLETVFVDDSTNFPGCKGMWIVEKQGGMFWVQWNGSDWDALTSQSEYEAYYPWWMGADEMCTEESPFTVAATYEAAHRYAWDENSNSWEPTSYPPTRPIVWNSYYRWHDAAFYALEGVYDSDHYIASAVNCWTPTQYEYKRGLYIITDGSCPSAETEPIPNTADHYYSYIYRDLEAGNCLYAWYHDEDFSTNPVTETCDFQKITVTNPGGQITATVATDFDGDTTLLNISGFYQYIQVVDPGDDIYHQFIVAQSHPSEQVTPVTWDIWHRQKTVGPGSFSPTWDILCEDLEESEHIAGSYPVPFNLGQLPSGIYPLRLTTPAGAQVAKVAAVR